MKTNNSHKSKTGARCSWAKTIFNKTVKTYKISKHEKGIRVLQNMTSPVDKNKIQRESRVISEINSISQNNFNYSQSQVGEINSQHHILN